METITIETITPDKAKMFLAANRHNRPLNHTWVQTLTDAMKRGEWRFNGEAIKFASNGDLLDGQNRLHAVARSGSSVRMVVVRGLEQEIFDTLDQGRKRSPVDIFSLRGEKNSANLAAATKAACSFLDGSMLSKVRTVKELEAMLEQHPSLRVWTNHFCASKARAIAPSATATVLALGSELHGDEPPHEFLHGLSTGAGLSETSPLRLLRERLIDMHLHPLKRVRNEIRNAYVIKCWNAFITGTNLRILRYKPDDEVFPVIK